MTLGRLINTVGFQISKSDIDAVNGAIQGIKSTATKVLGAIGIGFSLSGLNTIVEEFGRVNDQIRNSTEGLGDQAEIQEKILEAATLTRSTYEQTAQVVADLVHENSQLFGTIDEAITFNNAATMLFKVAGKNNEQISGLMGAINKSFAKGYVDSETLSQLLENSPEAVELLNKELGTTSDQLEQMASDGKFTVKQLKDAFINGSAEIAANFSNVAFRISDAITYVKNKFGLWITNLNEATRFTDTLARTLIAGFNVIMAGLKKIGDGIVWVVDKLGGMRNALKLITITVAALFAVLNFGKVVEDIRKWAKEFDFAKLKILGVVAIIVLLALAIEDFYHFMQGNDSLMGEMLERAGIDCDEFREKIKETFQNVVDFVLPLWQGLVDAFKEIGGKMVDFWKNHGDEILAGFGKAISDIGEAIYKFVEWITGAESAEEVMYNIGKSIGYFAANLMVLMPLLNMGTKAATISYAFKKTKAATDTATKALTVVGDAADKAGKKMAGAAAKASGAAKSGGILSALAAKIVILFNAIKNKTPVLDTLKVLFPTLTVKIQQFVAKIASIKNVFNAIKSAGSIGAFINQMVAKILTKLGTVYPGMAGIVTKCLALLEKVRRSGGFGNFLYINFQNLFSKLGVGIKKIFSGGLFKNLFSGLGTKLAALGPKILTDIKALFTGIGGAAGSATAPILAVIAAIAALVLIIPLIIKNWDKIKAKTTEIWNAIKEFLSSAFESIKAKCREIFENIRSGISEKVEAIRTSIQEGFQKAIDWITSLPSKAIQWGRDIIDNIVNGIKEKVQNVVDAVSGIATTIKSYIGFSEPETGPLSDFHTYMPDMIDLMVEGINDGEGSVQEAVSKLASTFTGLVENGTTALENLIEVTENGIKKAVAAVQSGFEKMGSSATKKIKELKSKIQQGMNEISNWMERDFVPRGKTWGEDLIENMIVGIGNSLPLLEKTLKGTAKTIQDYIGFSEPDVGPLSNFHTYMPDMIDLMVKGISEGKVRVREAMQGLAGDILVTAQMGHITPATAAYSAISNHSTKSIVQNNVFNQQFHGERAAQKHSKEAMQTAATDVTAELARALKFT